MSSRDLAFLADMRLNARYALEFAASLTADEFIEDRRTNYAVVRCLAIIGEAANKVSPAVRSELPQLEWEGMIKLRHIVVHDYGRVDLKEVWTIVNRDLPPLVEQLTGYLARFP